MGSFPTKVLQGFRDSRYFFHSFPTIFSNVQTLWTYRGRDSQFARSVFAPPELLLAAACVSRVLIQDYQFSFSLSLSLSPHTHSQLAGPIGGKVENDLHLYKDYLPKSWNWTCCARRNDFRSLEKCPWERKGPGLLLTRIGLVLS
ncbi:hypothetical protein HOY82DRAFT_580990 [Tuber indicum]|nr:hypothetical protein HOY82DRAFT_580990 [Tuber indicum]